MFFREFPAFAVCFVCGSTEKGENVAISDIFPFCLSLSMSVLSEHASHDRCPQYQTIFIRLTISMALRAQS